jgi:hypothetical protein
VNSQKASNILYRALSRIVKHNHHSINNAHQEPLIRVKEIASTTIAIAHEAFRDNWDKSIAVAIRILDELESDLVGRDDRVSKQADSFVK